MRKISNPSNSNQQSATAKIKLQVFNTVRMTGISWSIIVLLVLISNIGWGQVPPNDDCSNAILLTESSVCNPTHGSTANATQSIPPGTCSDQEYGLPVIKDVWYKFVATTNSVTIKTNSTVIELSDNGCNSTVLKCGFSILSYTGLVIGQTYNIRIYYDYDYDQVEFDICLILPPVNDNCSGAISVTQNPTPVFSSFSSLGASQSPLPASCTYYQNDAGIPNDVWFSFTALTQNVNVNFQSDFWGGIVEVRGPNCGSLIGCARAGNPDFGMLGVHNLTIGATYYLRVYGDPENGSPYSNQVGTFQVAVYNGAPNADCADAITLVQGTQCNSVLGTTIGVQSLPVAGCIPESGPNNKSVWYKFVATTTNPAVQVSNSSGFPVPLSFMGIELRENSCVGNVIKCSTGVLSAVNLTIGNTYYVRIHSEYVSDFSVCVYTVPPCLPQNITDIAGCGVLTQVTNNLNQQPSYIGVTCNNIYSYEEKMFRFVAPSTGYYSLSVTNITGICGGCQVGMSYSWRAESDGCSSFGWNLIGYFNSANASVSQGSMFWTAGTSYLILVDRCSFAFDVPTTHTFRINCNMPPNDLAVNAIQLSYGATVNGTTVNALMGGENFLPPTNCGSAGTNTVGGVWYYIYGNGQQITVNTCTAASFDTKLYVFNGSLNSSGAFISSCAASNNDFCTANRSQVTWQSVCGSLYFVFVSGLSAQQGTFTLQVSNQPCPSFNIATTVTHPQCAQSPYGYALIGNIFIDDLTSGCHSNLYSMDGGMTYSNSALFTNLPAGTYNIVVKDLYSGCTSSSLPVSLVPTDTYPPYINTCPSQVNAFTDPGQCYATIALNSPDVTDNCGVASITNNAPGNFPIGNTVVTWTAIDNSGNSTTCTQIVTVNDNQPPALAGCPSNITTNNDPGMCSAVVTWIAPTANDNCGMQSFTSNHNSGDAFPMGMTTVTYTATDIHGNISTCSFTVTVQHGTVWYADADGDGFGNPSSLTLSCNQPAGYVSNDDDCDDTQPSQLNAGASAPQIHCGGTTTTITVTASGATPPYQYQLNGGVYQNSNTFVAGSGPHSIIVKDSKGCTKSLSITIAPASCPIDPNKCHKLVVRYNGKAASVVSGRTSNGAQLEEKTYSGQAYQIYKFVPDGSGYFTIIPQHATNKVIGVKQCSNSDNKAIELQAPAGTNCQKWSLTALGSYFIIKNKQSGHVWDAEGNITQRTQSNATDQQFSIVAVTCPVGMRPAEPVITKGQTTTPSELEVKALPNPSATNFTLNVKSNDNETAVTVRVMDATGRMISVYPKLGLNSTIRLGGENWAGGIYFAEVTQGGQRKVVKLVKVN